MLDLLDLPAQLERKDRKDPVVRLALLDVLVNLVLLDLPDPLARKDLLVAMALL